jgi:hypothetical protein
VSHAANRSAWARLIAKVYEREISGGSPCPAGALARRECGREADSESPLLCPRCESEMRLIAVITDPWSGYRTDPWSGYRTDPWSGYRTDPWSGCRTDPVEVRKILRHLLEIGRSPPGLNPSVLN